MAVLLVALVTSLPAQHPSPNLSEVLLLQKENDLLRVWLQQKEPDEKEMASDFAFVFPAMGGEIRIGNKSILLGKAAAKKSVSSSALFLSASGELVELTVSVDN